MSKKVIIIGGKPLCNVGFCSDIKLCETSQLKTTELKCKSNISICENFIPNTKIGVNKKFYDYHYKKNKKI